MLYLEDILEVIENVPQDIRDRTTDLRELDLGIQNAQDQLEDQIKSFFGNAKKMKPQERDAIYEKIRKDYYRLLDDADEKVTVATNMHDLLERYTRKLDQELEKFKYELEADSPGITEILEKRSLELDEPIKESQKENRYHHHHHHHNMPSSRGSSSGSSSSDWRNVVAPIKKEDVLDTQLSNQSLVSVSPPSSLSYTLGQIGAGSNAIAAAASQAIAATQQLQQGRRTASLKASYDAITHGVHPTEFSIGSELANAAQTALAASALPQDHHSGPSSGSGVPGHSGAGKGISGGGGIGSSNVGVQTSGGSGSGSGSMKAGVSGRDGGSGTASNKRQKKKHSNSASSNNGATSTVSASVAAVALSSSSSSSSTASAASDASMVPTAAVCGVEDSLGGDPSALESPDWTYDPNEPRYCTCNQVSYGDMVACDNPKCPVEWFHYPCVNITAPPKGKWYCPQCAASMNRRQRK